MDRRQALAGLAASAHLACTAAGALHMDFARAPAPLARYAALSGAESSYGFFAPGVMPELQVTFLVEDGAGGVIRDVLETGASREADRRYRNLVTCFWIVQRDPSAGHVFAASWAGYMFRRHPSATRVTVRVDVCDLPSMEAWRRGETLRRRRCYEETLVRGATTCAAGAACPERP